MTEQWCYVAVSSQLLVSDNSAQIGPFLDRSHDKANSSKVLTPADMQTGAESSNLSRLIQTSVSDLYSALPQNEMFIKINR